jgi:hypothetical protein
MNKNLKLMKKVLAILKANPTMTKSEMEHVNRLFMVSGSSSLNDLRELTDDLEEGNLPLL